MGRVSKKAVLIVVAVVLFFVFSVLFASSRATLNQSQADQIKGDWSRFAQDAINTNFPELPLKRVLAMIGTESKGDPNARGTSGEVGLMQPTPRTWQAYSEGTPFSEASDPRTNIFFGVKYLKILFDQYGTIDKATMHYNASNPILGLLYLNKVKTNERFFL